MNAIVQRANASTALAALSSLKAGISNVQQTMVRKSSDPFLRMLKDGEWVYGQEDIEVETGSLWAANPLSIEHGWTAWDRSPKADNSNGPLGEVMVPQSAPLPNKAELKDVGTDWEYQTSIVFQCLNGTDKGEQVKYKASSVGASKAMDELVKAISRQLDADETKPVPVVKFANSTYSHKQYGKVYEPVLDIVDWLPLTDEMPEVAEPEAKAEEPKAETATLAKRTRSVPATKPTEQAAPQADEDDELKQLEAALVAKKLQKEQAAKAAAEPALDPKAAAKAKLLAELAALEGDGEQQAEQTAPAAQSEAPAGGQPLRRRRS